LRLTLSQLPRVPHEVDALPSAPDVLEPRRLGAVALRGQGLAVALKVGGERVGRSRALRGEPWGVGERLPAGLALTDDGREPLRRRADLLVEPDRLLAELPELEAHLLAPLEQPLELALHLLDRLAEVREPVVALLEPLALLRLLRRELGGARPERLLPVAQTAELRGQPLAFGDARHVLGRDDHGREVALGRLERLVLLRLLRLPLERGELAFGLVHDVAHAGEVLPGRVELALGLVALLLVARDAGRLLDEDAPLVRLRRQDVVELVLVHDRVGARVRAGAGEEVEDVAQARGAPVEEVLALTRAVEPPRDRHFGPRHRQRAVVAEGQLDFGEPDRLSRLRAVEDQVFHALAAERLRALLAERPAHGLAYIRLSASVRPDDARDAG